MQKQIIILTLILAYFAYGVTLGFAPLTLHYTQATRNFHVYQKRPAILIVMKMNIEYPDMRLFQYYYDEYRAFWTIDVIGRRAWENSWEEYTREYPNNTPINLWLYMNERNRTHFMINPKSNAEIDVNNRLWAMMFEEVTDLQYMEHRVWRLRQFDDEQVTYDSERWVDLWGYGRDEQ